MKNIKNSKVKVHADISVIGSNKVYKTVKTKPHLVLLSFDLEDSDVGGTLAVELAILPGRVSYCSIL